MQNVIQLQKLLENVSLTKTRECRISDYLVTNLVAISACNFPQVVVYSI